MDRLNYAAKHSDRYQTWCYEVSQSPFAPAAKLEFALISAHTGQDAAVGGFLATRSHFTRDAVGNALHGAGVFAPGVKAGRIVRLRRAIRHGLELPTASGFKQFRAAVKIEGLGFCKQSFGLALISPLASPVVCLDTHICRAYGVRAAWTSRSLKNYSMAEAALVAEAEMVGMPPFAYQWAVWDYQRRPKSPDDHSFLWRGGRRQYQTSWRI